MVDKVIEDGGLIRYERAQAALDLHPLCTLFPRLSGAEFDALRDDIKVNGLRQPIVLREGMILDGGNRYAACAAVGVEPEFVEFAGENIVSFVLSANLHRRHMTPGQQAAIVASAQNWAKAQAVGKPKSGNVAGLDRVEDRAAQSGASERTQRMADKVARADPELARKVAHGEISLPRAVVKITPQNEGERVTARLGAKARAILSRRPQTSLPDSRPRSPGTWTRSDTCAKRSIP